MPIMDTSSLLTVTLWPPSATKSVRPACSAKRLASTWIRPVASATRWPRRFSSSKLYCALSGILPSGHTAKVLSISKKKNFCSTGPPNHVRSLT